MTPPSELFVSYKEQFAAKSTRCPRTKKAGHR